LPLWFHPVEGKSTAIKRIQKMPYTNLNVRENRTLPGWIDCIFGYEIAGSLIQEVVDFKVVWSTGEGGLTKGNKSANSIWKLPKVPNQAPRRMNIPGNYWN